jgi:hypothetical protein
MVGYQPASLGDVLISDEPLAKLNHAIILLTIAASLGGMLFGE